MTITMITVVPMHSSQLLKWAPKHKLYIRLKKLTASMANSPLGTPTSLALCRHIS